MDFSGYASGKEPTCLTGGHKRRRFDPWVENPMDRGAWRIQPIALQRVRHD